VAQDERRERLRSVFERLARSGLTTVRWFMLCDGRAGIRFDDAAHIAGLDDCVWRDGDAALEEATRAGLALVFVLSTFSGGGAAVRLRACGWAGGDARPHVPSPERRPSIAS